ncbi:hypothetical protein ABFA25_01740 [Mycobacterium lepromatosis]|uniref:hypothetical protein n=1 Tax=Mycobacterium lepromatosis TaxID=480418 RepID=UPI000A88CECD|nr:hypothetical protein [Mycobacterium lepromatosis]
MQVLPGELLPQPQHIKRGRNQPSTPTPAQWARSRIKTAIGGIHDHTTGGLDRLLQTQGLGPYLPSAMITACTLRHRHWPSHAEAGGA